MTTETRVLPAATQQVRAITGDDGVKRLRGYGVVFDSLSEDLGGFREEIAPTAANRSLDRIAQGLWDCTITQNHTPNLILGRTSSGTARVGADSVGVWYEVDLPNTTAGNDAYEIASRGDFGGSSFTFSTPKNGAAWRTDNDGQRVRRVNEFLLHEQGPVVSPAYLETTVAARSLTEIIEQEKQDRSSEQDEEITSADDADEDTRVSPTVSTSARRLRFAR